MLEHQFSVQGGMAAVPCVLETDNFKNLRTGSNSDVAYRHCVIQISKENYDIFFNYFVLLKKKTSILK